MPLRLSLRQTVIFAVCAFFLAAGPAIAQVSTLPTDTESTNVAQEDRSQPQPRPEDLSAKTQTDDADLTSLAERLLATEDDDLRDGETLIEAVLEPRKGGLDAARERGFLRMAVSPDPLMIAFDGEEALGVAVAIAEEMERHLADLPDAPATPTVVVPTPMPRTAIVDELLAGRTDFTTLTVTRVEEVEGLDYTQALITDVNDVPVIGAHVEGVDTLADLVTIPIYLSENGRYARNALRINEEREAAGLPPLDLRFVDGRLDDYDLIEMVEIGLIPATIASDFKARFWQTIYSTVAVREDLALTRDGRIAWAVRSDNPQLQTVLDGFADLVRQGTLLGNVVLERYASSAEWIENIGTDEARMRIDEVGPVIRKYAETFEFEPDLLLAQAYQESRLDQTRRSDVGAIGVMQVMPRTAADPVVGIPDVTSLDNNVHAGVKYLRWLRDTFFDDPAIDPLDRTLLAFAAYNAGPGGVKAARARAREMGLDPHVWFENVEIAIQSAVSREPAIYVRNIFKYFVAYRLLADLEVEAAEIRGDVEAVGDEIAQMSIEEREAFVAEELDIVVGAPGEGDVTADDGPERTAITR